jgi:hypothetical protein
MFLSADSGVVAAKGPRVMRRLLAAMTLLDAMLEAEPGSQEYEVMGKVAALLLRESQETV